MTDNESDKWYSIKDAAKYLEIGEPTLYRWMRDRKITFRKVGDSTRFLREDLDAVIEVYHSKRDATEVSKRCPVCHGENLIQGVFRSTGLVYFQPKKTKFLTLHDSNVKTTALLCSECGFVSLYGDLKKVEKLSDKTISKDASPELD